MSINFTLISESIIFISIQANNGIGFNQQKVAFSKIRCRKPYTKESKICTSSNTKWRRQTTCLVISHNHRFTIANLTKFEFVTAADFRVLISPKISTWKWWQETPKKLCISRAKCWGVMSQRTVILALFIVTW